MKDHPISRRRFLGAAALAGVALPGAFNRALAAEAPAGADAPPFRPPPADAMPVIDTHIHLFDPFRPGGVSYPNKNNPAHAVMYLTSKPARYRPIAEPLGIVGAIEIECSALLEDNQWVLDVCAPEDIMVGTIGHLTPGTPDFRANLDRFHKNPLFRGIRYGLGRQSGREFDRPEFVADLKYLADADLVMDTANPSVALLADVVRATDHVPNLRVVIDHLPQMIPPTEGAAKVSYDASMKAFRDRPQIFVKVSEVLRNKDASFPRVPNEEVRTDTEFYRPRIDEIVDVFGMDRVLYGSDWPNGDQWRPVPVGFKIVYEYFMGKGRAAAEKYFWRNSIKCYKWVKRTPAQSKLS
ncbi:MAG: amidohydrolase family protein [Verrucomicrobiota bacterium]|jgi:predicted TIM-barrel fold metal-dependent hydrolase